MDLTLPPAAARAAEAAGAFVESQLLALDDPAAAGPPTAALAELEPAMAASPLAHFVVCRQLGRVPLPWARVFRAAGLPFHDGSPLGLTPHGAGLVSLALGDPRRLPDPAALTARAVPVAGDPPDWRLHGVALAPGYLAPPDALIVAASCAAAEPGPGQDDPEARVGAFLVPLDAALRRSLPEAGMLRAPLEGAPGRLLARGAAAWRHLLALRRRERLAQIGLAVGACQRAHELTIAAVREAGDARDDLAIGQGIQFHVADNAIDLEVAGTLALECAVRAEAGTLTEADLGMARFMVVEALERVSRRAAHAVELFAPVPPAWTGFFIGLARALALEGGALELDRRAAAAGLQAA